MAGAGVRPIGRMGLGFLERDPQVTALLEGEW